MEIATCASSFPCLVRKQDEGNKVGAAVHPVFYLLGEAPASAIFISAYTASITEADGTQTLWYEINYNHRQAWVLASNILNTLK